MFLLQQVVEQSLFLLLSSQVSGGGGGAPLDLIFGKRVEGGGGNRGRCCFEEGRERRGSRIPLHHAAVFLCFMAKKKHLKFRHSPHFILPSPP